MRALSIRQPYAEEILRGLKTVEYRTRQTTIIGKRFYIYAGLQVPEQAIIDRYTVSGWKRQALLDGQVPRGVR